MVLNICSPGRTGGRENTAHGAECQSLRPSQHAPSGLGAAQAAHQCGDWEPSELELPIPDWVQPTSILVL